MARMAMNEFVIALGYKGEVIKDYFLNFYAINNDITIDLASGKTAIHDGNQPQLEDPSRGYGAPYADWGTHQTATQVARR